MSEKPEVAPKPAERPVAREPIPPDTILIGRKPVMNYATAVMMHFSGGAKTLVVKARGRAISTAVDVVEVVRRRFSGIKIEVKDIAIGTESVGEGADRRNISTIEIRLEAVG
jgi:DNA-binding protein